MIWLIAAVWIASGILVGQLFRGAEQERDEREEMRERLVGVLIDDRYRYMRWSSTIENGVPVSCPACVAVAVLIAREHCLEWPMGRAIVARRIQEGRCEPHTHLETV